MYILDNIWHLSLPLSLHQLGLEVYLQARWQESWMMHSRYWQQ